MIDYFNVANPWNESYIQIGLRLAASIFYFYVMTCGYNVYAKVTCDEVVNFGTANVSGVQTHGAHHPALTHHNADIENISIEDVTKFLSCSEFYILSIYFSTHWQPPKTTTVKFSP